MLELPCVLIPQSNIALFLSAHSYACFNALHDFSQFAKDTIETDLQIWGISTVVVTRWQMSE